MVLADRAAWSIYGSCVYVVMTCRIPKEKYFPVPGVDGALVTFKLLPPAQRLQVPDERGFISMVSEAHRRHQQGHETWQQGRVALRCCAPTCMVCGGLHALTACLLEGNSALLLLQTISYMAWFEVVGRGAQVRRQDWGWVVYDSMSVLCMQVKKAFSERRKMLRNTLQPLYSPQQVRVLGRKGSRMTSAHLVHSTCWVPQAVAIHSKVAWMFEQLSPTPLLWTWHHALQVEEALTALGSRKDARAQDLSPPQFAAFYRQLQEQVLSQLEA